MMNHQCLEIFASSSSLDLAVHGWHLSEMLFAQYPHRHCGSQPTLSQNLSCSYLKSDSPYKSTHKVPAACCHDLLYCKIIRSMSVKIIYSCSFIILVWHLAPSGQKHQKVAWKTTFWCKTCAALLISHAQTDMLSMESMHAVTCDNSSNFKQNFLNAPKIT